MFRHLLSSALLVSALILPQTGVLAQDGKRTVELTENADYYGHDLRTEKNLSLEDCSAVCVEDKACRAFTYNAKARWCFLKSDFQTLNAAAGATAGKIIEQDQAMAEAEEDLGAAPKLAFINGDLMRQAVSMRAGLSIVDGQEELGADAIIEQARAALADNNDEGAIGLYMNALALDPDNAALWLERARADRRVGNDAGFALQSALAALNGYALTRTASERAEALAILAGMLDKSYDYRTGLTAYKASLALVDNPDVQAAYRDLRDRQGFRVVDHTIDSDAADPRACVQFSEALVKTGVDYSSFVTLDGRPPAALEARGNQICVEGLKHGQRYQLAIRQGLPSSVDEDLTQALALDIYVRDRSSTVRFTGENFVLPSTARRGIPLVTINSDRADLKLYRVGDRNLATLMTNAQFLTQLDSWSASAIGDQNGELVWEGSIDVATQQNAEVTTSVPIDEVVPNRKPGIYVMVATTPQSKLKEWEPKATQWFVVSDIGLTTFTGSDGLSVFARSLETALPLAGVELQLIARNNEILGTATTDDTGKAVFAAGLARGNASAAPAAITARKGSDDFVFLDMTRAGFDLSDRGVTGRPAPGPIDLFAFTERGIYRAGETVHASVLTRNDRAEALDKLPLTLIFYRPDGVEDRRFVADDAGSGGHFVDFALQGNAMLGTWRMAVYTDPKAPAIAEKMFLVDDFVPDRTEVTLTADRAVLDPAEPAEIAVSGRYLYGAPAAGLALEGQVRLKPVRSLPALPGFQFGLADVEDVEAMEMTLETAPLDEKGEGSVSVALSELPATTRLLAADITVRMRESGGRAVERVLTLPVKPEGTMIGIKPEFSGDAAENSTVSFTLAALAPSMDKVAMSGATWTLTRIERNYQWYRDGSSWRYEPIDSETRIDNGAIDIAAAGSTLSLPIGFGRYRLDISGDGAESSVAFDAGWFVEARSTETPDGLEIGFDKDRYAIGDTAVLTIGAGHPGRLQVLAGADSLISVTEADIGETGGRVKIPVTEAWGAGTYVTATLFRPGQAAETRLPNRSIGVKWLPVDPGNRALAVSLALPKQITPQSTLEIPVSVASAQGDDTAFVAVAAVDVGILNLTRFETPDPEGWYFGQRQLGLEIRDLYGRLIDGSLGLTGKLRTGGDGGNMALNGSPPTERLVAFFSGPVKLDADGKAVVSMPVPQFNGSVRVMAVAWSRTGVGHADGEVVIRDPVTVTANLPKFMAPGDKSRLLVELANNDAPAGDYALSVSASAGLSLDSSSLQTTVSLTEGGRGSVDIPLTATAAGDQAIVLQLTNAATGLSLEQTVMLPVRSGDLPITSRHPVTLKPGQSLAVNAELLAGSRLDDAALSVTLTKSPAFDIPALLMTLDRYPYGCAEQTTSRALPLLYVNALSSAAGLPEDAEAAGRIRDAITRVLSYQSSTGAFGLWSPGSGDLWLDAYVTDFLTRAREQKFDVPEEAMVLALNNLQNEANFEQTVSETGNQLAYALYVLARNKKAALSDLRYYADVKREEFPSPLSRAHLAAALALYGDSQRAAMMFDSASRFALKGGADASRSDYGSALRDDAAILSLAAESQPEPAIIPALLRQTTVEAGKQAVLSTQEQSWMLMAARALKEGDSTIRADIDGTTIEGAYSAHLAGSDILDRPMTITNKGTEPVTAVISTVAAPDAPLPAGGNGFDISRAYYTLDGEEADITQASQNDRFVVVLTVNQQNDWAARLLVTDMLPAGFEIDNPALVSSASISNFDWLPETETAHLEFRSDRFVAALDLGAGNAGERTLAYVVRAVSPGTYTLPAAVVEDMYRPQLSARTATGMMQVAGANR